MSRVDCLLRLAIGPAAWFASVLLLNCTPKDALSPRFPHRVHLESTGLNCHNCHSSIPTSTTTGRPDFPGYAACSSCHRSEVGQGRRYGYDAQATFSGNPDRRHVIFSHQRHMRPAKGQCVQCHKDVESNVPTQAILPAMAACLGACHQKQYDDRNCTLCHQQSDLVTLRPVTDIPHGLDYVPRHATDALRAGQLCRSCHTDNQCTACHSTSTGLRAEVQRLDDTRSSFRHGGDYITRHAIEARTEPTACVRCHQPSSCDSCHVRNGVSGNARGGLSPHPAGWTGRDSSDPTSHGRAARRQVVECASCHEQGPATNCIRCHKVGAFGGNPHPAGWSRMQSASSGETCRYCHER